MNIQDRKKTLTVEELRRRYNLDSLDKDRKAIKIAKEQLIKVDSELNNFVEITTKNIKELQDQVDGNITTWFFNGVPTLNNEPANSWTTDEDKINHLGDLYYDQDTGYAYRWAVESNIYSWSKIVDADVVEALAVANSAQDTADSKRRVFVTNPIPPYDIGDIWIKDDQDLYRCRASRESGTMNVVDWILATKYTDDTVALGTKAELDQFKIDVQNDYVTNVQLETNNKGIYANVAETYSTKTEVSKIDGKATQAKEIATTTQSELKIEAGKIESINKQIGDRTGKSTTITQDINSIASQISDIADITTSANTSNGTIPSSELKNVASSFPIRIEIKPINTNISYLYPNSKLFPSHTTFLKTRKLRFTNESTNEIFDYILPENLLYYDENIYDEFIADYESNICQIIKRCKYNTDGTVSSLSEPIIKNYSFVDEIENHFSLTEGDYSVKLLGYQEGYIFVRLMVLNAYTAQYATKVELSSSVKQASQSIESNVNRKLIDYSTTTEMYNTITQKIEDNNNNYVSVEVGKKVDNKDYTSAQILLKINNDTSETKIKSDKLDVDAIATYTNSKLKESGSTVINGSNIITGSITADKIASKSITANQVASDIITTTNFSAQQINADKITSGTISTSRLSSDVITTTNFSAQQINADNIKSGTISTSRLSSDVITTNNFSAQEINADRITSGSLSADRINGGTINANNINVTNINGTNVNRGTISGASINIYNGTGFFKMLSGSAYHPYVSALNVAAYANSPSASGPGLSFRSSNNRDTTGNQIGYISYGSNGNAIYHSNGAMNIDSGGNLAIASGGYIALRTGGSSDDAIYVWNKIDLNASGSSSVWAKGNNLASGKVKTDNGSASSRIVKENIEEFKNEYDEAYELLKQIKLYSYDYKYNLYKNKHQFGFIIDDIEKLDNYNKFFDFQSSVAKVEGNEIDFSSYDGYTEENKPDDCIVVKKYDSDVLDKYLLTLCKAMQNKIDKLEEKINGCVI